MADPYKDPGTYVPFGMQPYWSTLESTWGLPYGFMRAMAGMESGGGKDQTSGTGAVGPFQFTQGAADAVGIPKDKLRDPFLAAAGAARYGSNMRDDFVKEIGREPTGFEIYMMHNQGKTGAIEALKLDPETKIKDSPFGSNILKQGVSGLTGDTRIGDFIDTFRQKYAKYDTSQRDAYTSSNLDPQSGNNLGDTFNSINKLLPGIQSGETYRMASNAPMSDKEMWLRINAANNPELQRGGEFYRYDPRISDTEQWLRTNAPGNSALQQGGEFYRSPIGAEEAWLRQYDPSNAWLQQGTGPYSRDADFNPTMSAEESWLRRWAPNSPDLQNGKFQLAKGGSNTGVGLVYDPSTGAYVPNTGGMGEEERWERQFAPDAPDLKPGGKYGGPAPTPPPALSPNSGPALYPTAAELNGFQTPVTPISYAPPDVSNNPAASASTIPGAPGYIAPDWQTPSFGSLPGGVYGAAPLGGGTPGVSTNPGGIANPFYLDPNAQQQQGGGGITVRPAYPGEFSS